MAKRLVLFDIDGTLISTGGFSVSAMHAAYRAVWGIDTEAIDYRMSGKTDLGITHDLLALAGLTEAEVEARLPEFWRVYSLELEQALLPERVRIHPGVPKLVEAVARHPDLVLGLLTGNISKGATIKMTAAGLDGFQVGAFGEHHKKREELPPRAIQKARETLNLDFSGKEVVILGDTPNDIACGRDLDVRSIAVATGGYSLEELRAHQPDHLFDTFAAVPQVMEAILAGCPADG